MAAKAAARLGALPEDAEVDDDRLPQQFRRQAQESLLDLNMLHIGAEVGHGAFSKVYRGDFQGHDVAIKKILVTEKDMEKYLTTELAILKCVDVATPLLTKH
jgi:hypothetical protein